MQSLLWVLGGGLSFWIPALLAGYLNGSTTLVNLAAVLGVALFGVIAKQFGTRRPRWGWILVGVYVLGPPVMLAPSAFAASTAPVEHHLMWALLFCAFPPITLWMSLLNGTIFSLLATTAGLAVLATRPRAGHV
ncbi:MAG TPA: hypothetical protein VIE13_09770 [Terriglobales bacterium]|jgi:hypothetical protein